MSMRDIAAYVFSNLSGRKTRNKNIIIIISVTVMVFNVVTGLVNSVIMSSDKEIVENQNLRYIEVNCVGDGISPDIVREIEKIEGVDGAFYNHTIICSIEYEKSGYSVFALAVTNSDLFAITGKDIKLSENEIIIGDKFKEHGINVKDRVTLSYNMRLSATQGTRENSEAIVKGFYEQPVLSSWGNDVVLVSEALAEKILEAFYGPEFHMAKEQGIGKDSLLVVARDIDTVSEVARKIETDYEGIMTWYSLKSSRNLPFLAQAIIFAGVIILILLLLMSIIVTATTVENSIRSRYREIGIIKAIGFLDRDVYFLLLFEFVVVCGLSSIISIAVSFGAIFVINIILENQGHLLPALAMNTLQILISVTLVFTTVLLSAAKMIKRASVINISEVLRHE